MHSCNRRGMRQLVADRFVRASGAEALDLATGRWVTLCARPVVAARRGAWRDRCARLVRLRHPHIVPLIDCAECGDGDRASWLEFYAASVPAVAQPHAGGRHALASACGVLHALSLAAGAVDWARIRMWNGRPALLPDETTGLTLEEAGNPRDAEAAALSGVAGVSTTLTAGDGVSMGPLCVGVHLQIDPLLEGLAETLDAWSDRNLCTVALEAPRRGGLTTLLGLLASEARRRGFVPVCPATAPLVETLPDLRGRTLVLIMDASTPLGAGASTSLAFPGPLVARWTRAGRAVALVVGVWRGSPQQRRVRLAGWCGRELVGAVALPTPKAAPDVWSAVERAAHEAAGVPGLFVDNLHVAGYWCGRRIEPPHVSAPRDTLMVAEEPQAYVVAQAPQPTQLTARAGVHLVARGSTALTAGGSTTPTTGASTELTGGASTERNAGDRALARARADVERAHALSARGRRAQAVALLRVALGTLRRRGARIEAGAAAMALGKALARQGHVERAAACLREAADLLAAEHRPDQANDATRAMGAVLIEAGKFDAAERLLWVAEADALGRADELRRALARVELMRCAFWQARFAQVEDLASVVRSAGEPVRTRARVYEALALIAQQRVAQAGRVLRGAAGIDSAPGDVVEWHVAHAVLQARVSNRDAALGHVRASIAAARAAALPLAALVCRVVGARVAQAVSAGPEGTAAARQLARARRLHLPALVGACVDHAIAYDEQRRAARSESRRSAWGESRRAKSTRAERATRCLKPTRAANDRAEGEGAGGESGIRTSADAATSRSSAVAAVGRVFDALFEGPSQEQTLTAALTDVLPLCQDASDEAAGLEAICRSLRRELDASAVFIVGTEPRLGTMAGVGRAGRAVLEACRTTLETVTANGLAETTSGLVGAVPIRTRGVTIGALGACWTLGTTPDGRRVLALLASVAAASAPLVWVLADRQRGSRPVRETGEQYGLLGVSPAMAELRQAVGRAAAAPFPVLIEGESGSGKELVARAIHVASPRRLRRFCPINCAALPDELLDAELFGHARGAFTGALSDRAGLFEEADAGTLFLDEVGDLSPRGQAKLLRTIQEGEVRRVGETLPRRVDVRVVAASNRLLWATTDEGRFRRDLLYRLDVIHLVVPPLRERREDVAVLARHFWDEATRRVDSRATLAPETLAALARYEWPGNVRELQNVLAALTVRAPARGHVGPGTLPEAMTAQVTAARSATLEEARRAFEVRYVRAALARSADCRAHAARDLGLTRQGLQKLMARLGIS
ncbi:MAG: hypothetical protein GEU99_04790 [Luteitalea sp.]|nr:hypothetical protein [Luteitalea sp.]